VTSELDLSIVIPAYREAAKIGADIRAAGEYLRGRNLAGEILVVDDGSPDDTAKVAQAMSAEFPELRVLSYAPNRGKGHALRFGIVRAVGRNIMFADSGLCVPYDNATLGLVMLEMKMCDIAHGSRRMRGSVKRAQPLYRQLGSRLFAAFIYTCMGVPWYISDTQCGFKLYRRNVAHDLYGNSFTDGFMYDTEVILRALRAGYQILEFPVLWSNDADTRYDPISGTLRNIRELVRIRVGLWRQVGASPLSAERTE
jgi:dolichyl-phosphate beta-glucosyltransferase